MQEKANDTTITVLLLSGLLCTDSVWDDVLPYLNTDYTVKPVSFQGFSSLIDMADYALSQAMGPVVLVGHSMGGRVALEAYRKSANRIKGLGLMNTGVHPTAEVEYAKRGELVKLGYSQGMRAVADVWLPPMMSDSIDTQLLDRLKNMVADNTPESFEGQQKALLDRLDAQGLLTSIMIPTLFLSGSDDKWSPYDQHEDMAQHVPGAMLAKINGAGHMALNEKPEVVAQAINRLLARVE